MKKTVYIIFGKDGFPVPHMQDFNLDTLIVKFIRGKLPELIIDTGDCHRVWRMYTDNGWRYIEVVVNIDIPAPDGN